jgi:putative transposase
MIVRHLHNVHELLSALAQPTAEMQRLRPLLCERFLGSVRRECLDHLFIIQEKQLHRVLGAYVQYFNQVRPHQGITQHIPEHYGEPVPLDHKRDKILSLPVPDGLHRDYRRSA